MPDHTVMRDRARQLRRNMTAAEKALWSHIRRRKLGGFRFRRQFPLGSYILDFVCFPRRLVLEMDGGQHDEERGYDEARTAWLNSQGFLVRRFWNHQVFAEWDTVEEEILKCLRSRQAASTPDLSDAPADADDE